MPHIDHAPGRSVRIDGQEWLHFSGTAYLGLAEHPFYQEKLREGLQRYGANFGGSRRSNLQLAIFAEAEAWLADWLGVEAVLTTSSGSLAGQLLIKYLERTAPCVYAPSVHPALIGQGHRYPGKQEDWGPYIQNLPLRSGQVLLSSSLDPLQAIAYDFSWLQSLPGSQDRRFVLDDSHGLGVLGEGGRGLLGTLPATPHTAYILLSSMGKALGVPGGLIAGSQDLIQELWESPFFGGASPVIPAYLYAFLQCQALRKEQLERLQARLHFFTQMNPAPDYFRQIPGHPVFYIREAGLADFLTQHRILISSFHYPTAQDPKISRIVINAAHKTADLEKLATLIHGYRAQRA